MLKVEFNAEEVAAEINATTDLFQKNVSIRGFRAGKVPRETVAKLHAQNIQERAKSNLLEKGVRDSAKEKDLRIVSNPRIEDDAALEEGKPFSFNATVEIFAPFELPEYKGINVTIEKRTVEDADVNKAINVLRERMCSYKDSDKNAEENDVVVINYTGTCEGKPIAEIAPEATRIASASNFWIRLTKNSFLPGFTEQLIGLKKGDKKTVTVDFPADFPEKALAGKKASFDVEILLVKIVELPEENDELAKIYGAASMDDLRQHVRRDLEADVRFKEKQAIEQQIAEALLSKVDFPLPDSIVEAETHAIIERTVNQAKENKTPEAVIQKHLPEIKKNAEEQALKQLKVNLILGKIALAEKIQPTDAEMRTRIAYIAQANGMSIKKVIEQLQKNRGFDRIASDISRQKTVDALKLYSVVKEVPAAKQ